MTADILLDPEGDLPTPPGVQVVESEVDFLRCATSGQSLLIRGARLCQWSQDFYTLHGRAAKTIESPRVALRRAFPALSSEQANELAGKIGREHLSSEELTAVFVLNACFPADYELWQGSPSPQHAARWLLWHLEHTPSEAETVILQTFASEMSRRAGNLPVAAVYLAQDAPQARTLLFRWLGAEKQGAPDWGEFPLELPPAALNQVKETWMKRIIASNGSFFAEMFVFPLPLALRQELARLTAEYYRHNSHQLTLPALQQISRYLDSESLSALEEALPPSVPSSLPEDENAVLDWFEHQYLPYRRWQTKFGDESARQIAVQHAQTFARWLLEHYPRWLLEGEHLAFQKSAHLSGSSALILCIVLDGLPAWDAEWFVQELSARVPRLTLLQKTYCFAALPTITEFAKEALLRGVPPIHAPQTLYVGDILPDNCSPRKHLDGARAGQVWFWRVEQPDKAYHFKQENKRERQVRAELQVILEEIQKVVQTTPDALRLKILLTSDHGRLMNPRSPRQLPVGAGIQAHGRAAWGKIERMFSETGFSIDEENGWVELFGERFGVPNDLRLAWGEASFANNSGTEAYPHGGLFPEEVIVPWFVFERDAQIPKPEITVTGRGEADMSGEVEIEIYNPSHLILDCQKVIFAHGAELSIDWKIAPVSKFSRKVILTPWPNKSNAVNLTATFLFVQPNGSTFTTRVTTSLEVETLYERPDDLLKDLDL